MNKPVTPLLAADIIIELIDYTDRPVVLIERRYEPLGWAIPGGFVDVGECIEQAAMREALEETCLKIKIIALLGIYSDPRRDQRGHTITAVYVAEAHGKPQAADDAKNLIVSHPDSLPSPLVFDHALVMSDYQRFRSSGSVAPIRWV